MLMLKFQKTTFSVQKLVRDLKQKLNSNSNHEAWLLLLYLTKKTKTQLLIEQEIDLSKKQINLLNSWINQITEDHKPIQYIIGSVDFCDIEVFIEPPILIPRPETEEITCWIIDKLKTIPNIQNLKIMDMCSGSGCIGLSIAKAFPSFEVTCVDINPKSISLIKKNIKQNKIKNVQTVQSNLFNNIESTNKYDIIISNPPYVSLDEWKVLDKKIKSWEDKNALIAKNNGLDIIEKIVKQGKNFLNKNNIKPIPSIILETGSTQTPEVEKILSKYEYTKIKSFLDMSKRNRWIIASL